MATEPDKVRLKVLPTGKPHISFSELSEWISCSWRHKVHQIEKVDLYLQSPSPAFGTAIHASNEDFLRTRVMKPEIAIANIRKTWEECRKTSRDKLPPLTDELYDAYVNSFNEKDQLKFEESAYGILEEVPTFLDTNFPDWQTIDAEHQLYEDVGGKPYAFKGFIDGVISCAPKRGKKRLIWLLDWKTSVWGWHKLKKQDPMPRHQLVLYKHFWSKKTNADIKDVRCGFVILKRTAKTGNRCELLPVSAGAVTMQRSVQLVNNMLWSLEKGLALKNRQSCMWCSFFDTSHCDSIFRQL